MVFLLFPFPYSFFMNIYHVLSIGITISNKIDIVSANTVVKKNAERIKEESNISGF